LADAGLREAEFMVEAFERLVKKGFRTPEQMRAKEQDLARAKHNLLRDQEKLRVLEEFTFDRQSAELTAKATEAGRALERLKSSLLSTTNKAKGDLAAAEATARWEQSQLDKLKNQLDNCQVRAPQDGIVVYAKKEGKRVELGASVHFKQSLFSLPDLSRLEVKAFVHESALRRVQPGQKCEVRVDAFPDVLMTGTVGGIDSFYDSVRHWTSGGVKEYATTIRIDGLPQGIVPKPGMSAQVQIQVGELADAMVVPIPAVAGQDGQYHCYVVDGGIAQRRQVVLGDNTDTHVEVKDGLREGEQVVVNARARAMSQQQESSGEIP
jgi:RND family efflux transporter MFP subunit